MNATATISPSQRPDELRYAPGVSCGQLTECMLKAKAVGANPIKRSFNIEAKWEVPNVILSKNTIAKNGRLPKEKLLAAPSLKSTEPSHRSARAKEQSRLIRKEE